MNYVPFLHLAAGGVLIVSVDGIAARLLAGSAWIYLVPVAAARLVVAVGGTPRGRALTQHSRAYKVWWFTAQVQMIFNRLPFLDEALRLVPGLYAVWLVMWGSRVSPFALWGPGVRVIDRGLLVVGRGAVIGAQSSLTGHLGMVTEDGTYRVDIAPVTVEPGAIVGARAGMGPGCRLVAGEQLPAGRLLQPFTTWRQGRKVKT